MATKIIYHEKSEGIPCTDGLAAAWVAKKAYPEAELHGCYYNCPEDYIPKVEDGDRIIIVDFSFPRATIEAWLKKAEVILIDHHKTAMAMLGDISTLSANIKGDIIFDMNESGATLAWKYFYPDKLIPDLLRYIKDRDLWQYKLFQSREINAALSEIGISFELLDTLNECYEEETFDFLALFGSKLLAEKQRQAQAAADRAVYANISIYKNEAVLGCAVCEVHRKVPVVLVSPKEPAQASDICEAMYTGKYRDAPFVACLDQDGVWSLRSNNKNPDGGYDVGELAKRLGGGGHHNASGFKMDKNDVPPMNCTGFSTIFTEK